MSDDIVKQLRDIQHRFIFQGNSKFALSIASEIERLRARVEELERQHPVVTTAGCQCPPGSNIHCANSWCPRKSLSFRVTSTSK